MIDLYSWTTPNGRKISILLEELGIEYRAIPVDIEAGEQFSKEFLSISPNNKIPAIVDTENDLALMESGAIMVYLAEKSGRFLPKEGAARYRTFEWLAWQLSGIGPTIGQVHHFVKRSDPVPAAQERFMAETLRLYRVLDEHLGARPYLAGDYSIADIATWPWIARFEVHGVDLRKFPNVLRWYLAIADRSAVQRGYRQPRDVGPVPLPPPAD